jgi:hypothetical protein
MLHANRLNGDRLGEESVKKAMGKLVDEYMAAVDQDKDDELDPDTARMWKEQVHEIAAKARLDQPIASFGGSKSGPVAHAGITDHLAPLKSIIEQATYIMQAVTREITDPDETILRGFGKQLGNSKKGDNGCKQGPRSGPASRRGDGGDPAGEQGVRCYQGKPGVDQGCAEGAGGGLGYI